MIPRRIFILWLQGESAAPPLVQMCLTRWRRLNPTWEVRVLDAGDVEDILGSSGLDIGRMQQQAISDVLRLKLLSSQGGVWVDATTFPTVPLDTWLPAVSESGFFAFRGHLPPLDVDSWCLAAEPDHLITRLWWQQTEEYWSRPRALISFSSDSPWFANYNLDPLSFFRPDLPHSADTYPYYWVMYLFSRLLSTDADFRAAWQRVPDRSSGECHAVQLLTRARPDVTDEELVELSLTTPVQKLSFKDEHARRWLRLDQAFRELDARYPTDEAYGVFVHDGRPEPLLTRVRASTTKRLRELGGRALQGVRGTG